MRRFAWRRRFRQRILGKCWETGFIELLHPDAWRTQGEGGRTLWVATVLHEMWHFIAWIEDEKRADDFAARVMR